MKPSLGDGAPIDVARLVETRLLVQSNSGGGKSWALRRLLEQVAGHVPWIVLDPEGEFRTLREEVDCIIAAPKDGDVVAAPHTAVLLARRLLELRVHAVVDLYEMPMHDRVLFVKRFCDALVDAPKSLWRPTLVILDEAHVFAPQVGSAESRGAVMDLSTRGRKRGFSLCCATQRISKLHKDVAAELLNKLIGRTGLDIDVKRANEELGFDKKVDHQHRLRNLRPGEFYFFGPAFDAIGTSTVSMVKVGAIKSTHPKAGQRAIEKPPAPSRKLLKLLGKELADLPKQASEERLTLQNAQATIAQLNREVAVLKKGAPPAPKVDFNAAKLAVGAEIARKFEKQVAAHDKEVERRMDELFNGLRQIGQIAARFTVAPGYRSKQANEDLKNRAMSQRLKAVRTMPVTPYPVKMAKLSEMNYASDHPIQDLGEVKLRSGAMRILKELVTRFPATYTRSQVATLCTFAPTGGTFLTYISDLKRAGMTEEIGGAMRASDKGIALIGDAPMAPSTREEVMAQWSRALRKGAYTMLEQVVANPGDVSRETLAQAVDMAPNGGTFLTYLSDLRRNGLVVEKDGMLHPSEILNP